MHLKLRLVLIAFAGIAIFLLYITESFLASLIHTKTALPAHVWLPEQSEWHSGMENGKCIPHNVSADALRLIDDLFLFQEPERCQPELFKEVCRLSPRIHAITCDNMCKSYKIGLIREQNGTTHWRRFINSQRAEAFLNRLLANGNHRGFAFVDCFVRQEQTFTQLLLLPPVVEEKRVASDEVPLSINIVFLDSLSRAHFKRMLPESVKALQSLEKSSLVDFRLVQSVKHRTYENVQALFAGKLDFTLNPFGVYDLPPEPLHLEVLFGAYRRRGYHTLWLEDLCWQWEWGLVKDLLALDAELPMADRWRRFQAALERAEVERVDLSLASCHVLKSLNAKDPFGKVPVVCFNGKLGDEYFLDYLHLYHGAMAAKRQPYISFFMSNTAHDPSGLRAKNLDSVLPKFIRSADRLSNTLTILLSDHGNSYGPYPEDTVDGKLELYHPFVFVLIPDQVRARLGPANMDALRGNQDRLVSFLDLHYTLLSLVDPKPVVPLEHRQFRVNERGLWQPVPENRTCAEVPRLQPNHCICQGFEAPLTNRSFYAPLADYALTRLNEVLSMQFRRGNSRSVASFGACQKLVGTWYEHISEVRTQASSAILTMYVHARTALLEVDEIFFVILEIIYEDKNVVRLLSFDRITAYAPYAACVDEGVQLKLCVCSKRKSDMLPLGSVSFNAPSELDALGDSRCLEKVSRSHPDGIIMEIVNLCREEATVRIKLEGRNMISTEQRQVQVHPFAMHLLFVSIKQDERFKWDYRVYLKPIS